MRRKMKKSCKLMLTLLLIIIGLTGCKHKIYSSSSFSASMDEDDTGRRCVLDIRMSLDEVSIPNADTEELKEKIGTIEDRKSVVLADGQEIYTVKFVYDMTRGEWEEPIECQMFSDSLSDMETILDVDLLKSTEAADLPGEVNYYMSASDDFSQIEIDGTTVEYKGMRIEPRIYLLLQDTLYDWMYGTESDDFTHMISEGELPAHILIGNNKEAFVFLTCQDVIYTYRISSDTDIPLKSVEDFVHTLNF